MLTLDEPLQEPADLLCTVRSLSGHTSFAWCRWYSLDVTVALPPSNRLDVVGADESRRRAGA